MALRCAILDDYQNIALSSADWSPITGDVDIKVFDAHLGGPDKVIAALRDFAIIVAMRERTGFPKQVIDALPNLKLLITTGMRNASIDTAAAKERGVTVCGTPAVGNPTSGIAIALMLELTRRIGYENARMKAGVRRPAPLYGEHTDEILTELGYARGEIDVLRGKKVIA